MSSSLFHTLNISRQDILSRLTDLDVTSNNLANLNTAGFKASRSNFQEMLNQQINAGTQLSSTQMLDTQGTLRDSTNPFDWAIQGEGFFSVTLPDGTKGYTRDGQFSLDADRKLVTASGYPLVWTGTIPEGATNLSISAEGIVTGQDAQGASLNIGTVQLARFANPSGLTSRGDNVWLASEASGPVQTGAPGSANLGTVSPYRVEQSSIELTQEMTHLLTLQRSFSMSMRAFQQTDTMISQAINLRKA
jgi:flagellar basal-body rod protein FlgG